MPVYISLLIPFALKVLKEYSKTTKNKYDDIVVEAIENVLTIKKGK